MEQHFTCNYINTLMFEFSFNVDHYRRRLTSVPVTWCHNATTCTKIILYGTAKIAMNNETKKCPLARCGSPQFRHFSRLVVPWKFENHCCWWYLYNICIVNINAQRLQDRFSEMYRSQTVAMQLRNRMSPIGFCLIW